jgi:alpha-galactosidase/6-phospho-beta-glucosidase family protein
MEEIDARHAGLNHFGWVTRARHGQRDLLDELKRADSDFVLRNIAATKSDEYRFHLELGHELFNLYGVYPCPLGHMTPYFFHDLFLERQVRRANRYHTVHAGSGRSNWDRLARLNAAFDEREADSIARVHKGKHAELAIGVVAGLAGDLGRLFAVNLPNAGALPGVPSGTIVETYALVNSDGFTPLCEAELPKGILARINQLAAYGELVVQGILERNLRLIFQALCSHPFTRSVRGARSLFRGMLERERDVMGPHWQGVPQGF